MLAGRRAAVWCRDQRLCISGAGGLNRQITGLAITFSINNRRGESKVITIVTVLLAEIIVKLFCWSKVWESACLLPLTDSMWRTAASLHWGVW